MNEIGLLDFQLGEIIASAKFVLGGVFCIVIALVALKYSKP